MSKIKETYVDTTTGYKYLLLDRGPVFVVLADADTTDMLVGDTLVYLEDFDENYRKVNYTV